MIHLVSLEEMPRFVADHVCRRLYMAYAIGCDHGGRAEPSEASRVEDGLDALVLLNDLAQMNTYRDDRTVFITALPLAFPEGPLGIPPADGFADLQRGLAVVTSFGITRPSAPLGPETEDAWIDYADRLARRAVQQVGFLWGLHRCVDPHCAMYVPWSGAVIKAKAETDPTLCDFCRGKSELRLARTRS